MLEVHPRGQTEDVKGKGTMIKPSLEMMRFFFFLLKSLHFSVTSSPSILGGKVWQLRGVRQYASQDDRSNTGVWPLS